MENRSPDSPRNVPGRTSDTLPGEAAWISRRERFYERAIGPLRQPGVFHWDDDDNPHIDVYAHGPTPARPHQTMVTGGMADRPLPGVPAGSATDRRVELIVDLPRSGDWLAIILREIAGVPFRYHAVLTEGTLIMGGRPIRPGSALRHAVLANAERAALSGFVVEGEFVRFLAVLFITDEELHYGRSMGGPALIRMLRNAGVAEVLDVDRESVV